LAGETEVLGENLPQRHFCPSQNPTCLGPVSNPGPQRWETPTSLRPTSNLVATLTELCRVYYYYYYYYYYSQNNYNLTEILKYKVYCNVSI
jgi:hypothetical protein